MSCLYCQDGADRCDWCDPPARTDRDIDRMNKFPGATATQKERARKGYHAMGHPMPKDGEPACEQTCKTCGHLQRNTWTHRTFLKCRLTNHSSGKATDIRARWPACARWESEKSVEADERDEANAARMP